MNLVSERASPGASHQGGELLPRLQSINQSMDWTREIRRLGFNQHDALPGRPTCQGPCRHGRNHCNDLPSLSAPPPSIDRRAGMPGPPTCSAVHECIARAVHVWDLLLLRMNVSDRRPRRCIQSRGPSMWQKCPPPADIVVESPWMARFVTCHEQMANSFSPIGGMAIMEHHQKLGKGWYAPAKGRGPRAEGMLMLGWTGYPVRLGG